MTDGRETGGFTALDWGLVAAVALMWGSSFLLIDIGVDDLEPGLVAFLRTLFGAVTLGLIPAARRSVRREDLRGIALLGVLWMAVPFVLFPVAEQWIDSSVAGMLNAATPLFTALVAAVVWRRTPAARQVLGLVIGFAGVVAITAPSVGGAESRTLGVVLVLLAALMYGVSFNITGPLQERNGALPVIWRAQLAALVLTAPVGAAGIGGSEFSIGALLAMAALGSFGTALAYAAFVTLVGRVGSTRASVTIYFLPAVAIVLGALFRDERIAALAVAGTALVALGAWLTSRRSA